MISDVVSTTAGRIRGAGDGAVSAFKGVPYGDDTGGTGRFRPPRPPQPWSGVRDCIAYGPSCPQMTILQMLGVAPPPEAETYMGVLNAEPSTGEDCLALNVWTPAPDPAARLPVLVWLHGGGWSTGSASWPLYDFTNLARNHGVVVVGVNHRVGILGFLDVSGLDDAYADSGNVGMLDIVAALGWIRANIGDFGGDPGNVTVFGESGGGAKTSTLLAMPAATGLFHKAYDMSGVAVTVQTRDAAAANSAAVLDALGIGRDGIGDLQGISAERLIEAEVALPGRAPSVLDRGRGFSPVLGPSLPQHPVEALRAGASADVVLVTGCTTDEVLAFLASDPDLWNLTDDGLRRRLHTLLGDITDTIIERYRALHPDDSPAALLVAIATDAVFRLPHVRQAEAKAVGGGQPAYLYAFAFGHPDPTGRTRAMHGLDMPYFFDNVDVAPIAAGPHAPRLVAAMSGSLAALAHTGRPDHEGLPAWTPYRPDSRATMCFDVESTMVTDLLGPERACWDGIDITGLSHR